MTQPPPYGVPAYGQAPPPGYGPAYQQAPPPGYLPQPPTKPKKPIFKRWWFWVAIIVVVGIIASVTGGSKPNSSPVAADQSDGVASTGSTAAAPAPSTTAKQTAGIGTAVRDGKFEFTVTSAPDCSTTNIGGRYGQTAQGVFCIVALHVSNIGDEAQTFDDSSQTAFDVQGRKYSTDTAAGIFLDDSHSFFEQLNPGSSVDGKIVFDVPAGTQLTSIELHDSMFSGGVKVSLG